MKKTKKYVSVLAGLSCAFLGLGCFALKAQTARADNAVLPFPDKWFSTALDGFEMLQGASVRKNAEDPGLRFSTTITKAAYDSLVATYPSAELRFYTLVDKASNEDEGEEIEILGNIAFSEEDNAYIYHASVIFEDLTEADKTVAYAMELEARSYVDVLDESGNVLAVYSAYGNDNVRSMRAVANAALLAGGYANDTEKAIIEQYVGEAVRCETLDFCEAIEGQTNAYLARGAYDSLTKGYSAVYYGAKKVGVISESGELTFLEGYEYFNELGDKVKLSFFNDENDVYSAEMQYVTKGIKTEADLSCLTLSGSEELTGFYALGNDLTTVTDTFNPQPNCATTTTAGFAGVFEGNGYELTLHRLNKFGLFGVLSDDAVIRNLSLRAFCSSVSGGNVKGNSVIAYQMGERGTATVENVYFAFKDLRYLNYAAKPFNLPLFYQTVSGRVITFRDVVIENNTYNAAYSGGVLFYQDTQLNSVFDNVFFVADEAAKLALYSTGVYTDYSGVEGLSRLTSFDSATEAEREGLLGVEIFAARGEHTAVCINGKTGSAFSVEVGENGVSVPVNVVSLGKTIDCTVSVLEGNGVSVSGNVLTASKACDGKISVSYLLNGQTVEEIVDVYFYERASFDGVHELTATATENYLVQNGATEYVLVLPSGYSTTLSRAKDEFITLFKAATNIDLSASFVVEGDGLTADSGKYISLGKTQLFSEAYPREDLSVLGRDGGRILTDGDDIYIVGGTDFGTLYAVYTFMSITFNYEQYSIDCMQIDETYDKALLEYDVTDIPDFAYRINNYGIYDYGDETDENWAHFDERMGFGTYRNDLLLTVFEEYGTKSSPNGAFHNSKRYLPDAIYKTAHPDWYATDEAGSYTGKTQLCYTAHGDEDELALMIEECAKKIENSLTLYPRASAPYKNTVTLTVEDGDGYCTCSACLESVQTYGSYSGMIAQFVNRVGELVEVWMDKAENEPYRRDDFKIIFFAYNAATNAPCVKNENGEWTAIDESVQLRSNVAVWLAPIKNIEYQQSIYAPINKGGKDNIEAWASLSDEVYYWTYSTNFSYYMYPYDSFEFFYEDGGYEYLLANGGKYIFNQAQNTQQGALTAWHGLKLYLDAKLSWNCNLNVDTLIDGWFNATFKEAAPTMKSLFEEQRAYYAEMCEEYDLYQVRSIYTKVADPVYWKYNTLTEWLSLYDTALTSVAGYQTADPDLYAAIEKNIKTEWVSTAYMLLNLWTNKLGSENAEALLLEFAVTVKEVGITNISEHAGTAGSGLIKTWIKTKNAAIYEQVFGAETTEETTTA